MANFRFATVQRFYGDRPKAVQWSVQDPRNEIFEKNEFNGFSGFNETYETYETHESYDGKVDAAKLLQAGAAAGGL